MKTALRILHLEDNATDVELIRIALQNAGLSPRIKVASNRAEFLAALKAPKYKLILSDSSIHGFDGANALKIAREKWSGIPFIFVSGFADRKQALEKIVDTGATDCVGKSELSLLPDAIRKALSEETDTTMLRVPETDWYVRGVERLVSVVQELSLARNLEGVMAIVRRAARELTGADGASFVLRDGDLCHYADEDAIAPLWKGKKFPMNICVSGWAMLTRQPVVIEDIYSDSRIPADAYRPTFVKSLAMVPIRTMDPVGAIGVYWADRRQPRNEEVKVLQALANSTSIAMENVQLYNGLEHTVAERTASLQALNQELEAFSYSISHDLRAPVRHISGFIELLRDEAGQKLSSAALRHLAIIADSARRMGIMIDDLLRFSRMGRAEFKVDDVNMNDLVQESVADLLPEAKDRDIQWVIDDLPAVKGDRALLKQVWINLLSNAVKYSRQRTPATIRVGVNTRDNELEFFVEDNGAGFDMEYADKLFGVFQRLHTPEEFEGTGIGLANVRRIVGRHGGKTYARGEVDKGATFFFTLPTKK